MQAGVPYSHGYYPPHGSHMPPPAGQFRAPYGHQMNPAAGGNMSFQSMTSHWSLSGNAMPPPPPQQQQVAAMKAKPGHHQSLKPPKPPDKPLLPYMRYSRKMWEQFKKTDGHDMKVWEVGKIIGQKWRELSEDEKQQYFDEYEADKVVYEEQLKVYKNSPNYRHYLEMKKNAERQGGAGSLVSQGGPGGMTDLAPPPPMVIAPPRHSGDPRIALLQQQQDDDEEDEYLTLKQLATVRFQRNHRLMGELFNKTPVPDTRTAVTPSRLANLEKQARSLAMHQKKLEEEVQQIENRYSNKKRKFLDDAEQFRRELKRIQDNPPTTWKKPVVQLSAKDVPESSESTRYTKL